MFQRNMTRRLKIGRFLGIDLFIHWTFWLLIIGVGAWSLVGEEGSPAAAGANILRIFALFLCVTLHEYGHAMMARLFSVRTVDITLLPIGGLARLERMPRVPWQEFLVAIAGPAVNVVIAASLLVGLLITYPALRSDPDQVWTAWEALLLESWVGWLLAVNISLVLFNMLPAFPMDGGRVLRSLLAMVLDYRRATYVAARIGLLLAVAMAIFAWRFQIPQLVLVAAFIGYAGWMESRQVEFSEGIRGIRVDEGMVVPVEGVAATESLESLVDYFSSRNERSVPVLGVERFYLGMLDIEGVAIAAQQGLWNSTAADLMRRDHPVLRSSTLLEKQLAAAPARGVQAYPVLDPEGRLVGLLDPSCVVERTILARVRRSRLSVRDIPIEAVVVEKSPPGSFSDTYL